MHLQDAPVRARAAADPRGAHATGLIDGTATPIDVNDLLFVVDLLITDYSSIVFEFSTLGRPMLFYAYDLDEYIAERDFYVPFEAFVPGRIVRTFGRAAGRHPTATTTSADKVGAFARRHFDHLDGTSTDRVIDELVVEPMNGAATAHGRSSSVGVAAGPAGRSRSRDAPTQVVGRDRAAVDADGGDAPAETIDRRPRDRDRR